MARKPKCHVRGCICALPPECCQSHTSAAGLLTCGGWCMGPLQHTLILCMVSQRACQPCRLHWSGMKDRRNSASWNASSTAHQSSLPAQTKRMGAPRSHAQKPCADRPGGWQARAPAGTGAAGIRITSQLIPSGSKGAMQPPAAANRTTGGSRCCPVEFGGGELWGQPTIGRKNPDHLTQG
jgi:hypothetical protein